MELTLKAILARCGSLKAALVYCRLMARDYPALRAEYRSYLSALRPRDIGWAGMRMS